MDEPDARREPARSDDPGRAVVAVLLAAGAGSRFAGSDHKLLASLPASADRPRESVVARSLARCIEAALGPVVLVTGAADLTAVVARAADEDGVLDDGRLNVVHNPAWASGQMSSIRCGLDTAERLGADRVVIGLGDQPGITSSAWRAVASGGRRSPIAVATYGGRRGNPVSLVRDVWPLLPADGDEGARGLMRIRPDLVREVPCDGSADDIDTVEDLQEWQSS